MTALGNVSRQKASLPRPPLPKWSFVEPTRALGADRKMGTVPQCLPAIVAMAWQQDRTATPRRQGIVRHAMIFGRWAMAEWARGSHLVGHETDQTRPPEVAFLRADPRAGADWSIRTVCNAYR